MINTIMEIDHSKISPLMKFIWEQQQSYVNLLSTGICYHHVVIHYCLLITVKLLSMYNNIHYGEVAGTEFFILEVSCVSFSSTVDYTIVI